MKKDRGSKIEIVVFLIMVMVLCSCDTYRNKSFLVGRKYIGTEIPSEIKFNEKGEIVFTWFSSEYPDIPKNSTITFLYDVLKDNEIKVWLASSQYGYFPYTMMKLSESGDEIYFTDRNVKSGIFKRSDGRKSSK